MTIKKIISSVFLNSRFLFLTLLFAASASYSQDEFPLGSPYTAFGLGDVQYLSSTRTDAMGIQGISLLGDYVNNLNPASNASLKFTSVSLSFQYSFLQLAQSKISDGNVNGINLGIPLSTKRGMTLILGFNSLIRSNYKIYNKITTSDITYGQTYAGNGGLSRVNLGLTYKFFETAILGFEYNYAFGNKTKLSFLDFGDPLYQNTYIRKENNLTGSFFKGGLILDLSKVIKSKNADDFTIGFLYQSKLDLNSDEDAIYQSVVGNDTLKTSTSNSQVPQAFGFGITKKFGKQLTLSGDVFLQQWSDFIPGNLAKTNYINSARYGLGAEIGPAPKSDRTMWENMTYRVGVFYDNDYFTINDQKINRFGISAGLGIPLGTYNSIDLGISYSFRGKSSDGLIQEKYLKLTAGLNFGELWFIRPRDEER